ncbi:MAG: insulinase family protein, partial [Calditrichota bacterium]
VLHRNIKRTLFSKNAYGYESGGDPDAIPQLTQQMFVDYYRRHYHPSNSYIFLYGDLDCERALRLINDDYLAHFQRIKVHTEISPHPIPDQPLELTLEYPLTSGESETGKWYFSRNWVLDRKTDPINAFAYRLLQHILLETPASPLKKALLEARLGQDVLGSLNNNILQPVFSVIIKHAEADKHEAFIEVIDRTLKRLVREGIPPELVEASLNFIEFHLREADFRGFPKGLVYNFSCLDSWLHGAHPTNLLAFEEPMAVIREKAAHGLFEELIQTWLLDNQYRLDAALKPVIGLTEKNDHLTRDKLKAYKASMSAAEMDELIAQTKRLQTRQQEPDAPADIAKIPFLTLQDLTRHADELPLQIKKTEPWTLLCHPLPTQGVIYLGLYFDLKLLPSDLLPYASLLTTILGSMDTTAHDYGALSNLVNTHTGGFQYGLDAHGYRYSPDEYSPRFNVGGKALAPKLNQAMELIKEILLQTQTGDINRLREILLETKSRMEMDIQRAGHKFSVTRSLAYSSPVAAYRELIEGISFYHFVAELAQNYETRAEEISCRLQRCGSLIFRQANLVVSLAGDEALLPEAETQVQALVGALPSEPWEIALFHPKLEIARREGWITPAKVQYISRAGNFRRAGHSYQGGLLVLEKLLTYDYLWSRIREQGGAYGAHLSMGRRGDLFVFSFRDPNLKETVLTFEEIGRYISQMDVAANEVEKSIISVIADLDRPLTSSLKAERSASYFISGITQEDIQRERDEVLNTHKEDLPQFANLIGDTISQGALCAIGGDLKINENSDLFDKIQPIFKG